MTATEAGQPAKDPEEGHGASRAAPGADDAAAPSPVDADTVGADLTGAAPLTADDEPTGSGTAERIAALRARLMTPMPDDRVWGWIGPLLVTLFAAILRFNRLSVPNAVIFDETYYAKDAWSILQHGVEWTWITVSNNPGYVNNQIIAGHHSASLFQTCTGTGCGEYVVQPEVGKLLIAVGEWLFGLTTFGWRFMPAVFGTLAVLVMCRVARRLTRSTLLGCTAGLLLSLDGLEFVLSRTGILDIFLMFFVLAAFGALVVDRDVSRARLAEAIVLQPADEAGPRLGVRKWRVAAGVLIGLAGASKQDALWYVFAFVGLCVAWDIGARRTAGLRNYVRGALVRDGKWLPLTLGVIPLVTYILTWMNWLVTNTGYNRDYAQANGVNIPVISPL
ncbi:MAG: dolichyl-phosphate-mannose--protein mannosyltransferase, partial [Trebonia sp.]